MIFMQRQAPCSFRRDLPPPVPPVPSRPSNPAASVGATVRPEHIGRLARLCDRSAYTSTPSGRKPCKPPSICCGVPGWRPRPRPRVATLVEFGGTAFAFLRARRPATARFRPPPGASCAAHPAIRRRRGSASSSRGRAASEPPNRRPRTRFCRPPHPRSRLTSRQGAFFFVTSLRRGFASP